MSKCLRANEDKTVDLSVYAQDWEMWTPVKNEHGSWSFRSHHGMWLRGKQNGTLSLNPLCGIEERFSVGMVLGRRSVVLTNDALVLF